MCGVEKNICEQTLFFSQLNPAKHFWTYAEFMFSSLKDISLTGLFFSKFVMYLIAFCNFLTS
jgi:hypothetical protein